ncbi:MAG: nicotinate (nicotinamide) nucleotide adenylyltransferase [Candidatus Levybacteria bacterium RIFCSPLOWO2_02_FULL_36_8b]|nr:MAG: nicotinate (nicotinamide) nucleotide adenylyltransferase [Candidatus Levybacteria bacterium RIFCSPLOWO2_02_FULL_36_8b]
MRIGILGGSFDPPHLGHISIARQVRELMKLDQIWLMPYYEHSWDSSASSAHHRFAMTKLVEEKEIIVSDEEIKFKKRSYAIQTVKRLKKKYPHVFFWIIGGDVLPDFTKWKDYEKLITEIKFIIVPRKGFSFPAKIQKGFLLIPSPEFITSDISSSIIRRNIKEGRPVTGLISKPVLSYIQKHQLYE